MILYLVVILCPVLVHVMVPDLLSMGQMLHLQLVQVLGTRCLGERPVVSIVITWCWVVLGVGSPLLEKNC